VSQDVILLKYLVRGVLNPVRLMWLYAQMVEVRRFCDLYADARVSLFFTVLRVVMEFVPVLFHGHQPLEGPLHHLG